EIGVFASFSSHIPHLPTFPGCTTSSQLTPPHPTPPLPFDPNSYSESLFALLSFAAMWRVVSGRWFSASLLIALSAAARSNGVLHSGFFLFSLLQVCMVVIAAGMYGGNCCRYALLPSSFPSGMHRPLSAAARSNGVLHAGFFLFSLLQVHGVVVVGLHTSHVGNHTAHDGMVTTTYVPPHRPLSSSSLQRRPACLPLLLTAGVFSLQVYYHLLFASLPLCITAGVCLLQLASVHSLPHNLPQPNTELTGSALAPLPLPPCLRLSFNQQFAHPTSVAVAVQCCQAARVYPRL
ncbi:unnamed protein product, partial [Closterium sp. NIES-54]